MKYANHQWLQTVVNLKYNFRYITCLLTPLPYNSNDIALCTRHNLGDRCFKIIDIKKQSSSFPIVGISFMKKLSRVGTSHISSTHIVSQLNCHTASFVSHKSKLCSSDANILSFSLMFLTTPFKRYLYVA